jgi:hypothetical protein
MPYALREYAGFARASAGYNKQWAAWVQHGIALIGVKPVQIDGMWGLRVGH